MSVSGEHEPDRTVVVSAGRVWQQYRQPGTYKREMYRVYTRYDLQQCVCT